MTPAPGSHATLDLYLADRGGTVQLHASAKLGERKRRADGSWPDWAWWTGRGWSANTVPFTGEMGQLRFGPVEGREFQIERSRLVGDQRFLLVVSDLRVGGESRPASFPAEGDIELPDTWARLELR